MTRMPRKYTFRLGTASLLCALLLAGACTPTIAQRGNMLEDYQIAEIRAGESTRSDVLRNLGSPTTQSTFDPNVWYYIGQETEKRGILDPKVTQERVVLVAFNEDGTVQAIQDIDRDRINIPYERSKTQTHGNDLSIVQQLLGNLGRFNPQEGR
ncbi:MAG: outer membrane protein assembly factor BamE [Alphaproteobacteria bacterium]|nr:outer membrane protein assembly factor BamE [Alphaproteobacteria bacterium]